MNVVSLHQDQLPQASTRMANLAAESVALRNFRKLAGRQAPLSNTQLCEQQKALMGPKGRLAQFARQMVELGRQSGQLDDILELQGYDRREQAERAVDFALGFHLRRPYAENPFEHYSRAFLCVALYDELAGYTLAERYAASHALRQMDGEYFIKLIATTRDTVERRIVFHGLLEHFDALLPIERSIYPFNYRQVQQEHLLREETLYGRLQLDMPISLLLQERSPEWLLENLSRLNRAAV